MTLEILSNREELRDLIDAYSNLGDNKNIADQMALFTPDAVYKVYMNGALVVNISGADNIGEEFNAHASQVKTYFTLNGQHTVKIDGDIATGISFSQLKMIREVGEKENITDYSVRYDDKYVRKDGKWLIQERTGHFIILDSRPLNG